MISQSDKWKNEWASRKIRELDAQLRPLTDTERKVVDVIALGVGRLIAKEINEMGPSLMLEDDFRVLPDPASWLFDLGARIAAISLIQFNAELEYIAQHPKRNKKEGR